MFARTLRNLASSGRMADRLKQEANVMVVNAEDGLAEAGEGLVGKAGYKAERPSLAGRRRLTR
jgi:hypothetical protein